MALCLVTAGVVHADPAAKTPAPPPRLRIKNAQSITVALERRKHEPASGIRPEKDGVWNVVPIIDLKGARAVLVDQTPYAPRSRWIVDAQGDKLLLDTQRFIPTHVYQLDLYKEMKVVGTALVYLYPPPAEKESHVQFSDDEGGKGKGDKGKSKDDHLSSVPKGDL